MPISPMECILGWATLGVACYHGPWPVHTVEKHRAWQAIISLGHHTRSEDFEHGMLSLPLDCTHGWTSFGVAMLSFPLGSIHDWMTSSIKFHHCPLVGKHGQTTSAWHAIIKFRLHTQTYDVGHGMLSSPLCNTHGWTTSSAACHHLPWKTHTIGLCWAWYAIIALGQHTLRQRRAWHPIVNL